MDNDFSPSIESIFSDVLRIVLHQSLPLSNIKLSFATEISALGL